MTEIIENITGYLNEIENYITRLNLNRLSRKDRRMFLEMSEEYYNIFKEYALEQKDFPADLLEGLANFNANIINQEENANELANHYYESIREAGKKYSDMLTRVQLMQGVFQKDVTAYKLQDEKIVMLQNLVDLDKKLYNEVSKETLAILEVQHCELKDGVIYPILESKSEHEDSQTETVTKSEAVISEEDYISLNLPHMPREDFRNLVKKLKAQGAKFNKETKNWYISSDMRNTPFFAPYIGQDVSHSFSDNGSIGQMENVAPEQAGAGTKEKFRVYAYTKSKSDKPPKAIYGDNMEQLISRLQDYNRARTDEMKFQTCYVQRLNSDNKYENVARYDVITGEDITPIYLNLPHLKPEKFKELVAEIKAAGAVYSPAKKAFFITKQVDLNKFSAYLPLSGMEGGKNENRSKERSYTIESGREYYDNRVMVTIDGLKPVQIYGDDYDVHFPSMSVEETRAIIDKYVLPGLHQERGVASEIEYNGKIYNPLQYNVLQIAEQQHFTKEQMSMLERPELTADRMNEVRFAIRDGLTKEQIEQFADPAHEQWQMDICRVGMQNGFTYKELAPLLETKDYQPENWGDRRERLQKMIRERQQKSKGLLTKLDKYKTQVASVGDQERKEKTKELVEK